MAKGHSEDLRIRVVEFVESGASRRAAAARFDVGIASAIRWVDQKRRTGDVSPKPQGGDRRSKRIEAHRDFLLGRIEETPDVTLEELQAELLERGLKVSISTVWRFFDRHGISFKKNCPRRRAGAA